MRTDARQVQGDDKGACVIVPLSAEPDRPSCYSSPPYPRGCCCGEVLERLSGLVSRTASRTPFRWPLLRWPHALRLPRRAPWMRRPVLRIRCVFGWRTAHEHCPCGRVASLPWEGYAREVRIALGRNSGLRRAPLSRGAMSCGPETSRVIEGHGVVFVLRQGATPPQSWTCPGDFMR